MTMEKYDASVIIEEVMADTRESLVIHENDFILATPEAILEIKNDLQTRLKDTIDEWVAEFVEADNEEDEEND